jgi:hypothetical protein
LLSDEIVGYITLGIMETSLVSWERLTWALVGVPVTFGLLIEGCMRIGIAKGNLLPFHSARGKVVWFLVFGACLASGIPAFTVGGLGTWSQALALVAYLVLMAVGLAAVAVWLSVLHGDSI